MPENKSYACIRKIDREGDRDRIRSEILNKQKEYVEHEGVT